MWHATDVIMHACYDGGLQDIPGPVIMREHPICQNSISHLRRLDEVDLQELHSAHHAWADSKAASLCRYSLCRHQMQMADWKSYD